MNTHITPTSPVKISHRFALREGTAKSHEQLDDSIAKFATLDLYRRYLAGQYLFRKCIEEHFIRGGNPLDETCDWKPLTLLDAIRSDMVDLNVAEPTLGRSTAPLATPNRSSLLGSLYVIEGSNMGARMLYRDALALGLGSRYGASHLSLQSVDKTRWPDFLALLEQSDIDISVAIASANNLFSIAYKAFAGLK